MSCVCFCGIGRGFGIVFVEYGGGVVVLLVICEFNRVDFVKVMDYIIELYIVEVIVFNEDRCFFSGDCLVVNVVIFVVCVVVVGDFNVIGI